MNCLDSRSPGRADSRPPSAGVSPVTCLVLRWEGCGKAHRATVCLLLCPDLPNPSLPLPTKLLSCLSSRRARGLTQTSWDLSIFTECIRFSRRQCYPQMLKSPFGAPHGVPETAPCQEAGESFHGWFLACACLAEQYWFSAAPPLSLLPGDDPSDLSP